MAQITRIVKVDFAAIGQDVESINLYHTSIATSNLIVSGATADELSNSLIVSFSADSSVNVLYAEQSGFCGNVLTIPLGPFTDCNLDISVVDYIPVTPSLSVPPSPSVTPTPTVTPSLTPTPGITTVGGWSTGSLV